MQAPNDTRSHTVQIAGKAFCGLLLVLISYIASAEERVIDKKFPASAGGTFNLQTDTGSIVVSGNDTNEVSVQVTMRGARSALDKFDIAMTSDAKGVDVQGHRTTERWLDWSWVFGDGLRIKYVVQIPRNYRVQITTSGGDMDLRNFNGTVFAKTSGGNINLNSINGDLEARTSGGDIHAAQMVGITSVRTSGGNVTIENAKGELSARTSGGNMRLRAIDGKLLAHTSGGNIEADIIGANRGVEVGTSGGNITLTVPKEFSATLNAHTSGGDVDCDLPITTVGHHEHRELKGDINGGGQSLVARTSGGDIRIRSQH